MARPEIAVASLTAAMIRRAPPPAIEAAPPAATAPAWHRDLRLFAITWAAGFVFFLAFLA